MHFLRGEKVQLIMGESLFRFTLSVGKLSSFREESHFRKVRENSYRRD